MNQAKKQRLVGTVVLVALAVILVPMILDFSRQEAVQRGDITVPPAPDAAKMQVLPLNIWSKKIDPEVEPEPVVVEEPRVAEAVPEAVAKPEAAAPEEVVATPPTEEQTAQPDVADGAEPPLPQPDVVAPPESDTPDPSLKGKAWMVQIGSFSAENKAFIFRNKLRKMGYAAYIVPGEDGEGQRFFRVRIGPEILHSRAEALRKQLKRDTGLDGLVMRFR